MRRIEYVYVDRQVEGVVADPIANTFDHVFHAVGLQFIAMHGFKAQLGVTLQVVRAVQRPANADMHRRIFVEQLFLGGAAEWRAVRVGCAEICVPGIEVGIEMHQRDLPGNPVERELTERILGPLNLKNTFLHNGNSETRQWANSTAPPRALYSAVWTAGAVVSTAWDIAKWGQTLFSGSFLQAASLERMLVFSDKKIGRLRVPMGMGVWDLSVGKTAAWGHGGQMRPLLSSLVYIPKLKLSVAYASSGGRGSGATRGSVVRV